MLKKSDLASQFELVVKQEIKNFNDIVSQIFGRLNTLEKKISENHSEFLKSKAKLDSDIKSNEIAISAVKENFDFHMKKLYKIADDNSVVFIRNNSSLNSLSSDLNATISYLNKIKSEYSSMQNDLYRQKEIIGEFTRTVESELNRVTSKVKSDIQKFKEQIKSLPSRSEKIKFNLEEKIYSSKLDVDAVMKEIKCLKSDVFISKKMIEKLETLIDRMKSKAGT